MTHEERVHATEGAVEGPPPGSYPVIPADAAWTIDDWRRAVQDLQARLEQSEMERQAWKRWCYEAEGRAGGPGRDLGADDLALILVAKGECYAIASGTDDPREMLTYQAMAKEAFERLQRLTEKLTEPPVPIAPVEGYAVLDGDSRPVEVFDDEMTAHGHAAQHESWTVVAITGRES